MNVIYFFIVLFIINIAMYLIMIQASKLNRKNSQFIQGIIIIIGTLLFTILDALIYSAMIGWNKECFHFQVSPKRKQCMAESVCRASKDGKCIPFNNSNLNTANFPPKESCYNKDGFNGCHKWTVGWDGNLPMNYNDWIANANVKETQPCAPYYQVDSAIIPQLLEPWKQTTYAHLNNYYNPPKFNEKRLPVPGPYKKSSLNTSKILQAGTASIKERYIPPFLHCTSMQRKPPCGVIESYEPDIATLEIDFYGTKGCGWCTKSKQLLQKEGVLDKVTYKDASHPQYADELRSKGSGGVPLFYSKKTGKKTVGYPGSIAKLIEKLK